MANCLHCLKAVNLKRVRIKTQVYVYINCLITDGDRAIDYR
jgi:hypothetical protein